MTIIREINEEKDRLAKAKKLYYKLQNLQKILPKNYQIKIEQARYSYLGLIRKGFLTSVKIAEITEKENNLIYFCFNEEHALNEIKPYLEKSEDEFVIELEENW